MRYHKGNVNEAVAAAKHSAARTGEARYIVPTCFGLNIEHRKPPVWQRHICVEADGTATSVG